MGMLDVFKKQDKPETAIDMSDDQVPLDRHMMEELAVFAQNRGMYGTRDYYNPDDVVGRFGLPKYTEMYRRDDMVRNATNMKLQARLSTGWDILPADAEVEPRAEEMADFARYNLEHMAGEITEAMRQIYSCIRYGYSITEINLSEPYDRGPYKGKIGLRTLKTKNPEFFDFDLDEFGNIKTKRHDGVDGLLQGDSMLLGHGNKTGRRLPPEKFIIMTYNGDFGNVYGESDYRACFRNYRIKDAVLKFWSVALERYGMPTIFLKILQDAQMGEGKTKEPEGLSVATKQRAKMIVKNLQAGTSAFGPGNMELERIEEMKGRATYHEAIQYHDRAIARAILLPSLVTEEGQRSGSLAMSKSHLNTFALVINHLGRIMEDTLDEQLLRRLIDWNYPSPQAYPFFRFKPMNDDRLDSYMARVKDAITVGVLDPAEPFIRDGLEFPAREEPKTEPEKPQPKQAGKAPVDDLPEKANDSSGAGDFLTRKYNTDAATAPNDLRAHMLGSVVPYLAAETIPGDWPSHESLRSYVELLEDLTDNWGAWQAFANGTRSKPATASMADRRDLMVKPSEYSRPLTFAEKRVDFQGIQRDWLKLSKDTMAKLEPIMREVKAITVKRAQAILTPGKMTAAEQASSVAKFVLAPAQMNAFRQAMNDFYNVDFASGVARSADEIQKATGKKLDFAEGLLHGREANIFVADAATPAEALDFMKNKSPVLRRMLLQYDRRAFTVTGVERERILSEVKYVLQTGIARGHSVPTIMGQVGQVFDKYLVTGEIKDGVLLSANRLETIVRTNLSEAFNTGRLGAFRDPELAGYIEAYEYTAIIDPRTTEFCEMYDTYTRPSTDPIWSQIWPPNHFNCRSTVVAAVTGDPWERTENTPGVEPQPGFQL